MLEPIQVRLLSSAAEGQERDAPAELLRLLYCQMRRLAGPRDDLDDLVQAAAERALRAWPRFEGRSSVSTWTYGIVYRTLLDHERWSVRWRRRFRYFEEQSHPEPQSSSQPEAEAIEVARARRLHLALSRLPPAKRAVVVLHELEGLAMKEVSEIVGANERTVRSRLRDARHKLASILRKDPLFDPEASSD